MMGAVGDLAKVRLLLDRGAAVNATMKDGTTALVAAARRGNTDVMRLLLDRQADAGLAANGRAELLRIVSAERPEARQILAVLDRVEDPRAAGSTDARELSRLGHERDPGAPRPGRQPGAEREVSVDRAGGPRLAHGHRKVAARSRGKPERERAT